MSKKLLFVVNRIFWPAMDGHKAVLYAYCKSFYEYYGYDVYLYAFREADQDIPTVENLPAFIRGFEIAENITNKQLLRNLICGHIDDNARLPLQSSAYESQDNHIKLKQYAADIDPDVVVFDMIRLAGYERSISGLSCKKILYMEDVLSKRYQKQLERLDDTNANMNIASPIGKLSGKFPPVINSLIESKFITKLILRTEIKRLIWAENYYLKKFDEVILVSPVEAKLFSEKTKCSNVCCIPLGVDVEKLSNGETPEKIANSISFIGDMRAAANADSVKYIIEKIIPLFKIPIALYIIGTYPEELKEAYQSIDNIHFLGRVDDLRQEVLKTTVFCSPITYGSGIKTKILEAMAMGIPIVTNDIGNEGIGLVSGEEAIIANEPKDIAEAIERIISSPALASKLVSKAYFKVKICFNWKINLTKFDI